MSVLTKGINLLKAPDTPALRSVIGRFLLECFPELGRTQTGTYFNLPCVLGRKAGAADTAVIRCDPGNVIQYRAREQEVSMREAG